MEKWMQWRWWMLAGLLGGLLAVAPGLPTALQVNNSLEIWFDESSPALQNYRHFNAHFGGDEVVVLLLKAPNGILQAKQLAALKTLHADLKALPAVGQVTSAADLPLLEMSAIGLRSRPLLQGDSARIASRLASLPGISRQLFNADRTATRLLVQLAPDPLIDQKRGQIIEQIKTTARQHWPANDLHFGGVGVVFAALNALTEQQFGAFVLLAYMLMLLLLWWLFRSSRALLITLGTMLLASIISLGVYGLQGHQLNLMTVLLPMLILLLSTMDAIHLLYAWQRSDGQGTAKLKAAFARVWRPCLFTTLTTMAGFLALLASPMVILREFGLYSALGIGLSLPITWLLAACLLPTAKIPDRVHLFELPQRIGRWTSQHPKTSLWSLFTLLVLFGWGISKVRSDTYTLGYLPANNLAVRDHQQISQHWGPYIPLELLITRTDGQSLVDSSSMHQLLNWQKAVKKADLGDLFGFVSLFEAAAQLQGEGSVAETAASAATSAKILRKHYPALWANYHHDSLQQARMTIFGEMQSAAALSQALEKLQTMTEAHTSSQLKIEPVGYLPLYAQIVPDVTKSQVQSLLWAALLIGVLLIFFLRSIKMAAIALLTNAFPLVALYGWMGWMGIELDIATASIGAIGLSFCIDDALHFAADYQRNRRAGLGADDSLQAAFDHTGKAIFFSSMVLFVGFACMLFSPLKTVFLFGMLSCWMIFWALFAQMLLFSRLVKWLDGERAITT